MENQQRGKFTEKQNKANKTNNARSKTAKTVLLWSMYTFKMKASPDNNIINTFQKKMDKERQKVKGSFMSDFRFNQRPKGNPSLKTGGQGAGWSRWQSKLFSSNSLRQILPWNVTIHATTTIRK